MSVPSMNIWYVSQISQSEAFYQQLLGSAAIESSPSFAMFQLNSSAMLGLWSASGVLPPLSESQATVRQSGELCLLQSHRATVDQAYQHCLNQGLAIAQVPSEAEFGYSFVVLDPDRNRIRYLMAS
ncbi:VOC family protein [Photobacterium sp. R1]